MSVAAKKFAAYADWCRKTDIASNGIIKKFRLRCLIYIPMQQEFTTEFYMDVGQMGKTTFTTTVPVPAPPHKVTVTADVVKSISRPQSDSARAKTPGIFEIFAPDSTIVPTLAAVIEWQTKPETAKRGIGPMALKPRTILPALPDGIPMYKDFFSSSIKTESGASVDYIIGISKVTVPEQEGI